MGGIWVDSVMDLDGQAAALSDPVISKACPILITWADYEMNEDRLSVAFLHSSFNLGSNGCLPVLPNTPSVHIPRRWHVTGVFK